MKACIIHSLLALAFLAGVNRVAAQGTTAFTYQGQLRDGGTNANGSYMMVFALYDAVTNGNQIGTAITNSLTLANGLFSVNLDFGAGAFNGSARWLDITVSNGVAQTLSPRVQVLPTPYSLYASTAGSVINTNGSVTAGTITATNLVLGGGGTSWDFSINSSGGLTLAYGDPIVAVLADTNGILSGNGGGLTNVSAVPRIQAFRSSDTFTVPANVTRIMVEMWGAGGGGGIGFHQDAKYDDLGNLIQPEIDNGGGGGGAGAWAVPYWFGDAAFAVMTTLLAATDAGLGACFLGNFRGEEALLGALSVPPTWRLFGAVLLGYPDGADHRSASLDRKGPPIETRLHRGGW